MKSWRKSSCKNVSDQRSEQHKQVSERFLVFCFNMECDIHQDVCAHFVLKDKGDANYHQDWKLLYDCKLEYGVSWKLRHIK